jgi:hypothetical protein
VQLVYTLDAAALIFAPCLIPEPCGEDRDSRVGFGELGEGRQKLRVYQKTVKKA